MKLLIQITKLIMKKIYYIVLLLASGFSLKAQINSSNEQLPLFPNCEDVGVHQVSRPDGGEHGIIWRIVL